MADELKRTVRIVRNTKIGVDERGRNVWTKPIQEVELDLVSTTMLKRVLDSGSEAQRKQLAEAAQGKDGVLAHDPDRDRFEIIDDDDLKTILESDPQGMDAIKAADVSYEPLSSQADTDDEELSLVSTQALRRILSPDEPTDQETDDPPAADSGFDPYNKS